MEDVRAGSSLTEEMLDRFHNSPPARSPRAVLLAIALALSSTVLLSTATVLDAQDEDPASARGLSICFQSGSDAASRSTDCRTTRLLALYVPEGEAPSILQKLGPFRATLRGFLEIDLGDEFQFSFEGRGKIELSFDGKKVATLESDDLSKEEPITVELDGGKIPLELRYESPAKGDAYFRSFWASFDWRREPIPPTVFFHDPSEESLSAGLAFRRGRELFATHHCMSCHPSKGDFSEGMPELAMRGPSLVGIADRVSPAWIASWVNDPKSIREAATMPKLLRGSGGEKIDGVDRRAWDLAAYLASFRSEEKPTKAAAEKGDLEKGGELFADLGCIGCHSLSSLKKAKSTDDNEIDETPHSDDRISLDHVASKWSASSLTEFLRDPDERYPWIRMPDFRLSETETTSLVTFVLSKAEPKPDEGSTSHGDAANGKELFEELGCANCHESENNTLNSSKPLGTIVSSGLEAACLADSPSMKDGVPDFGFSKGDRAALRKFLSTGVSTLARRNENEFATRQIEALRCRACHARDGDAAVWTNFESEVGHLTKHEESEANNPLQNIPGVKFSVVQARPPLTWAGEKLRPEWTRKFLSGELGYDTRPWLKSRMPNFPIRAEGLSKGLALEHGHPATLPANPKSKKDLVPIGKKLVLQDSGFACVSCHAAGSYGGENVFEVPGLNFQYTTERLRKEHFIRWMLNPGRVVSNSRMPQFADDEGRSQFTEHFDGDAVKQFDAIWQWLLEGREISSPEAR